MTPKPITLLVLGAVRHYGWSLFPDEVQGMASKGLGAFCILVLLYFIYRSGLDRIYTLVLGWFAWEELQVLICSGLYIYSPWEVPPGQGICSALVGLDIGAFGIMVVAFLLLPVSSYTTQPTEKR